MKKICGFILFLLTSLTFYSNLKAQCSDITVEVFPKYPQSGNYNYFGVRVTLTQTFYQNVLVNGYIYDEGDQNTNHPFELTVTSGNLTAETSETFYETYPTSIAVINVSSVTPCPSSLTAETIFSAINSSELQSLINSSDSNELCTFLTPLATQISEYVLWKYEYDIRDDYDTTLSLPTVMTGLLILAKEKGYHLNEDTTWTDPEAKIDPFNCFMSTLSSIIGINAVSDLYHDFQSGESIIPTLWHTLKQFVKRLFAGIYIGIAIYNLGDCLDWW